MTNRIVLASASPRRRQLMAQVGIPCEVMESGADENVVGSAFDIVRTLAVRKAMAVRSKVSDDTVVIGGDTLVELDGEVLSKPEDEGDAFNMLRKLSGKRHRVYTGVALCRGDRVIDFVDEAYVFFRELSDKEIWDYIATGEPMDKAGAYGVQERGATLVSRIEGDFYTVMGLPVSRVWVALRDWGAL